MLQVLFRIPWGHFRVGGVEIPTFGFGLFLLLWAVLGAVVIARLAIKGILGQLTNDPVALGIWAAAGCAIWLAPSIGPRFAPAGIPFFGYGLMLFIGFTTAVYLATRRAAEQGIPPERIWDLAVSIFVPGLFGARLFFAIQYPGKVFTGTTFFENALSFVNLSQGGIVLFGGLLMGTVAYFVFCHWNKIHPLQLADIITPSIFVGVGFGRIGCLLNGCCYGDVCNLPFGIHFPAESVTYGEFVYRGIISPLSSTTPLLQPTQIYSAIDGFLIAAAAYLYFPYRTRHGAVFGLAALTYAITRYFVELLRSDEEGQFSTSLTISQWVSLGVGISVLLLLVWVFSRPPLVRRQAVSSLPAG
jgi:phosphatidylglycerol:prolipoprotein diacylglycerol transferase